MFEVSTTKISYQYKATARKRKFKNEKEANEYIKELVPRGFYLYFKRFINMLGCTLTSDLLPANSCYNKFLGKWAQYSYFDKKQTAIFKGFTFLM
jgi:hypothetical protein